MSRQSQRPDGLVHLMRFGLTAIDDLPVADRVRTINAVLLQRALS
jgi:hypothetical protein